MRGTSTHFTGHVVTVALGIALALGTTFTYLALGGDLPGGDGYRVRALLPTTASLGAGSRVTMAGAKVGTVTKTRRQGYATLVELDISDERVLPLPADSRVTLRQRTPVGENYISIKPGTAEQDLPESAVLPVRQSEEYVDVDQLLSVLRGRTKRQARQMIISAGGTLDGRGDELNAILGDGSEIVRSAGHVLGVLADEREQLAAMIDRLGRVSASVGERGAAIRTTADRGLVALGALAARDAALAATLETLPSTLAQVRRTSTTLRSTSLAATPVVAELATAMADLEPAIADLEPAAVTGRRVVAELDGAAGPLRSTLQEVTRLSKPLSAALPDVRKTLCQLNPVVRYAAPYTNDVIAAIIGLGSASNSYDAVGHLIRLSAIANENSSAGQSDAFTKATFTLLRSGLLTKGTGLTWHPYPEAGKIGTEGAADTGNVLGPEALAETGYEYPRVHADC